MKMPQQMLMNRKAPSLFMARTLRKPASAVKRNRDGRSTFPRAVPFPNRAALTR
jgi:hypothetical protein